jgi:hypothetical protein
MTASEKSHLSDDHPGGELPVPATGNAWGDHTLPQIQQVPPPPGQDAEPAPDEAETGGAILGFPIEVDPEGADEDPRPAREDAPASPAPGRLVFHRHAENVGGGLLILAGLAAATSLALPWVQGDDGTGWSRVRSGLQAFGGGIAELSRSGLWQSLAPVLGGFLLLVLGLLLLAPARTHRFLGLLALLVAAAAAAGVLVLFAGADWDPGRFASGAWCAVAVAVLGLLGALKAMLTGPRIAARHAGRAGVLTTAG